MAENVNNQSHGGERPAYYDYLSCPACWSRLSLTGSVLICDMCEQRFEILDGIPRMLCKFTPDENFSVSKWERLYSVQLESTTYLHNELNRSKELYGQTTYSQLAEAIPIKDITYLEIGCGTFLMGQEIANDCRLVIGVDYSRSALEVARRVFRERGISNYLLVQGDIRRLPIRSDSIDLVFGGGVIEHFRNRNETQCCLEEIRRVLVKDGVSINAVPYLNIGTLYRQIWGNIPDFPLIKQLAELVHVTLLQGKHMVFGYEMSFTSRSLEKMHKRAGFKEVTVDRFETGLVFAFVPKRARKPLTWLAMNSRLFWPIVKAVAKK